MSYACVHCAVLLKALPKSTFKSFTAPGYAEKINEGASAAPYTCHEASAAVNPKAEQAKPPPEQNSVALRTKQCHRSRAAQRTHLRGKTARKRRILPWSDWSRDVRRRDLKTSAATGFASNKCSPLFPPSLPATAPPLSPCLSFSPSNMAATAPVLAPPPPAPLCREWRGVSITAGRGGPAGAQLLSVEARRTRGQSSRRTCSVRSDNPVVRRSCCLPQISFLFAK